MRQYVALTLAVALAGGASAAAAPRGPACNLVVDATYDDQATPATGTSPREASSPRVDIVSADVASDSRVLTAVVRVRDLSAPDPGAAPGASYHLSLRTQGETFRLFGERSAESERYLLARERDGAMGEIIARVSGMFDEDRSEVRITASLREFRPCAVITRGTRITTLAVDTFHSQGVAEQVVPVVGERVSYLNGVGADAASGGRSTYAAGSPSCVTPDER